MLTDMFYSVCELKIKMKTKNVLHLQHFNQPIMVLVSPSPNNLLGLLLVIMSRRIITDKTIDTDKFCPNLQVPKAVL